MTTIELTWSMILSVIPTTYICDEDYCKPAQLLACMLVVTIVFLVLGAGHNKKCQKEPEGVTMQTSAEASAHF